MYRLTIQQPHITAQTFLHTTIDTVLDKLSSIIKDNGYSYCCYTSKVQYSQYKSTDPVILFIKQHPGACHIIEFPDKVSISIEPIKHPLEK